MLIAASAALTVWQSIERLLHPQRVEHVALVAAAAAVGILGNELVAQYRLRVGRRIGSAALVADGHHARGDGLTSLGILISAIAVALGAERADPIAGILVSGVILVVLVQAARSVGERLMDAVDPELVDSVRSIASAANGVASCGEVRIRWVGHRLHAGVRIVVDRGLTVAAAHGVAEAVAHDLYHQVQKLSDVIVHVDPAPGKGADPHELTAHHRPHPHE